MKKLLLLPIAGAWLSVSAYAENYSIDWHKIAGGGGTSAGGAYTLSGTIGQHDAGGSMAGGAFSLTGGFWAITAVAAPGVPNLTIISSGPGSVTISWPATGSFVLQQASNIDGPWSSDTNSVATSGGVNHVAISPATGIWFFRLKQ